MKTINLYRLPLYALLISATAMSVYGAQITTVTGLTGGPNPGTAGSNVTIIATVFPQQTSPPPPVPTGNVTFTDNLGNQYTTPLTGNTAQLILQPAAGTYTYTAVYNGDTNYFPSPVSLPFVENVEPATTTNLTVTGNPAIYGQPLTLTATVTGRNPTGRVTFYDNVTVLGVAPLVNGQASITINSLPTGLRDLAAYYGGDSNNVTSASGVLTEGILPMQANGFGPPQTYPTGNSAAVTILSGDVNGDGTSDLVVVNGSGSITVYLGLAGGQFGAGQSYATGSAPVAGVLGDFNADGKMDVAVASSDGVDILYGNGDGSFQASVAVNIGGPASGIAMTDFNRDGFPDIVAGVAGGSSSTVDILLSKGDGTFQPALSCSIGASVSPAGIVAGDFNGDGTPDIAVSNGSGISIILGSLNIIAGNIYSCQAATLIPGGVGANSSSMVVKDFTGDGEQDIAVTNPSGGTVSILLGNGDGTFNLKGSFPFDPQPVAVASADFNGDGITDLVVADSSSNGGANLYVMLGNGDGTFGTPYQFASDSSLAGVVTGPFSQNTKVSLAAVSSKANQVDVLLSGVATLSKTLGDTQSAPIYTTFPTNLSVNATGFGAPAAHVLVTFTASNGSFAGVGSTATVLTDNNGNATAPAYTANGVAGPDNVTATAGGNTVTFALTNNIQPCTFTISPTSLQFTASGGQATITVTPSASNCIWSAATSTPGILLGNTTETGNGAVHVLVSANPTGEPLTESFLVAGTPISVQLQATSQIFADVLPSAYYFDAVNEMYLKGITSGCSATPLLYCPTQTVTRAQMAVFLVRSVYGGDNFTYNPTPYFNDVPTDAFGFKWIQKLFELGITTGCSTTPSLYCPNNPVTRAQMAIFVIRMRYGATTEFDFTPTPYFTDVPADAFGFDWIQRMKEDNITSGCTPTTYCPNNNVIRQDMSVFITRGGFNFEFPAPEPIITSINPATITSGGPTTVTVTGSLTHFDSTTIVNPIPGVTIGTPTIISPTSFTVVLTPSAPGTSPVSIWVTTSSIAEEAILPNALTIQ